MSTQPTRSQLIGAMVTEAILRTRLHWQVYAAAVVDHYHASVDVLDRVQEFHVATTADNADRCARTNTQAIKRMLTGETRMPADLEESLIAALPEEWRRRLLRALLDRQGLMLADKPTTSTDALGQVSSSCALLRSTASAVERVAPMLEDQVICAADAPLFPAALEALSAVMGVCLTLTAQINNARQQVIPNPNPRQGRAH